VQKKGKHKWILEKAGVTRDFVATIGRQKLNYFEQEIQKPPLYVKNDIIHMELHQDNEE